MSGPATVTDVNVAVEAAHGIFCGGGACDDGMDEVPVTNETIGLKDVGVVLLDHDGLVKVLEGEALGVVPAIVGFGDQLRNERVR